MQSPELFACLSKERKENLLGTLLFRPSIYERLYYEEEMVRKQIVCYEEFLQIVRNPQIRAAAPEIDFEFEEFSANSYLSLVDEYLYWNKVPGDILLRLKKAAEDALYHHLWYDEKSGYPREYTYKGNDNAILYQILTCADCLDAATDSVGRAYSSGKNFADMLADLRCNAGRMFNPDLVQLFVSKISCRLLTSRIIRLCESRDCCTCLHGLIRNIAHGANTF